MSEIPAGWKILSCLEKILPERKPVRIENGVLLKEDTVGSVLVSFNVACAVAMPIDQVRLELSFLDVFEKTIGKPMKLKYKKLKLSKDESFTVRELVKYPNAFNYSVTVTDVIFIDNSVWRASFEQEREESENSLTKQF